MDNTSTYLKTGPNISSKRKKRIKWSSEEDSLLITLANKNKKRCWKSICSHFSDKNEKQCYSRYKILMPKPCRDTWTPEEDAKLINLVNGLGKHWADIAKHFPDKSSRRVRARYVNVLDVAPLPCP